MDEKPISLPAWLPWATTACFAALAACLGELWVIERMRLRQANDEAAIANASLQASQNQLEAERIVTRRQIADLEGRAAAPADAPELLVRPNGEDAGMSAPWAVVAAGPTLLCAGLPRSDDARGYQLWASLGDGTTLSLAEFEGTGEAQRVPLRRPGPSAVIRQLFLSRRPTGPTPTLEDAKAQGLIVLASPADPQRK